MQAFFQHNWLVRQEWFDWCHQVSEEELLKQRTGGVGGILHTLFHMTDVEWSWIQLMKGEPDFQESFSQYSSLEQVERLDSEFRGEVESFVAAWDSSLETRMLRLPQPNGSIAAFAWGDVMRHVIAHHIHHAGQLSVWSREIGLKPVSSYVIGRNEDRSN